MARSGSETGKNSIVISKGDPRFLDVVGMLEGMVRLIPPTLVGNKMPEESARETISRRA